MLKPQDQVVWIADWTDGTEIAGLPCVMWTWKFLQTFTAGLTFRGTQKKYLSMRNPWMCHFSSEQREEMVLAFLRMLHTELASLEEPIEMLDHVTGRRFKVTVRIAMHYGDIKSLGVLFGCGLAQPLDNISSIDGW